ncbi:MAG: type II secretion system protein [Patescibacteria group bacterium]
MIFKFRIFNTISYQLKASKLNRGMTYVELIVVLSIFSVMTSVVLFNYQDFQARVDIKNLASDIALKIVEAQKSAILGVLPSQTPTTSPWKPSYGLYFYLNSDQKSFIYFTDLNNDNIYNDASCVLNAPLLGECLDKIIITKNNNIAQIDSYLGSTATPVTSPFTMTFRRPDSGVFFSHADGVQLAGFDYIQIKIASLSSPSTTASIRIYPSGRIQVN